MLYENDTYYHWTLKFVNYVRVSLYGLDPLEDLRPGCKSNGTYCPIAKSFEELANGQKVFASHFSLTIGDRLIEYGGGYRGHVTSFIRRFDDGDYPKLEWNRND